MGEWNLFQTGALHSGESMVGIEFVETLALLAGQDAGLGALLQDLGGLLHGAGLAMDTGEVDGAVLDAV